MEFNILLFFYVGSQDIIVWWSYKVCVCFLCVLFWRKHVWV